MDDLSLIMKDVLPLIEKRMNTAPSIFNLWFGEIELTSLTESAATLLTTSQTKRNILYNKYLEIIKQSFAEVLGFEVEIIINYRTYALPVEQPEDNIKPAPPVVIPKKEEPKVEVEERNEEEFDEEKEITEYINSPTVSTTPKRVGVYSRYTFDNFVEGSSNKLARAACYAVAEEPTTHNPLFIYGNSGLGKTHLLWAIINHMRKKHPGIKIVYKKCETFLAELIKAINTRTTEQFKEKYRTADVLLIDDIQFLAGKEGTQEEFFNTFNVLYESDKQIILTSDRPPKDIKNLEDRIRTRFEWGLLADVQPPNYELRIAIIKKKADEIGISITEELIAYMAERLKNNIRQIEGVLKRLYALYSLTSTQITIEHINEAISIIDPGNIPTDALIERIISTVSRTYGISIEQMKSKKRNEPITKARQVAIYVIRALTDLTISDIGEIFSRDHATVSFSISKVETNIKTLNNFEEEVERIIKEVKGG